MTSSITPGIVANSCGTPSILIDVIAKPSSELIKILLKAFPFEDTSSMEMPEKYQSLWIDATVFLLLKRGAEGETTHNENGVNRSWASDDLPVYMLKEIVPRVG